VIARARPRLEHTFVAALAIGGGVSLWQWGASPAGRWLDHGAGLSHQTSPLLALAIFSLAWLLMTVATMMPTALPLLSAFTRVSTTRPHRGILVGAVVGGFLTVWAGAGVAAGLADLAVQNLIHRPSWHPYNQLILAGILFLAGAYQLSGLAGRCRDRCRTPFGFLSRHWTGAPDVMRQSFVIGADYGRSCLGCCAPLMAVMLVVGMSNLAWMYALAVVAAVQKQARWGERHATAVGVALIMAAGAVALRHVTP
jgi:predicted metal-binding membrane protein